MSIDLDDVRARLETDLDDTVLQRMIDSNEKAIARAAGSATVETQEVDASGSLWFSVDRPATSITSVTERRRHSSDAVTLSANDYRQVAVYRFLRLADGDNPAGSWGKEVVVTYVPEVDTNVRDRVAIELCAVDIEYRPFDQEKVGKGEWEGKADWAKQRRELLAQIREGRSVIA